MSTPKKASAITQNRSRASERRARIARVSGRGIERRRESCASCLGVYRLHPRAWAGITPHPWAAPDARRAVSSGDPIDAEFTLLESRKASSRGLVLHSHESGSLVGRPRECFSHVKAAPGLAAFRLLLWTRSDSARDRYLDLASDRCGGHAIPRSGILGGRCRRRTPKSRELPSRHGTRGHGRSARAVPP
jgi:hypothetical protein